MTKNPPMTWSHAIHPPLGGTSWSAVLIDIITDLQKSRLTVGCRRVDARSQVAESNRRGVSTRPTCCCKGVGRMGLFSSEKALIEMMMIVALSYVRRKCLSISVNTSLVNSSPRHGDDLEVLKVSSLH